MTGVPNPYPTAGTRVLTAAGAAFTVRAWRGEGSFARVYQGEGGGRPAALKFARPEIPGAGERLAAEARVLAAVSNPHVVQHLGGGAWHGLSFLVLEWLDGTPLGELVEARRRLAVRQALEIMEAVLDGLAALHAAGQAHGDLRPQNVLVLPGRCAVLLDPGAAVAGRWPDGLEGECSPAEDVRAAGALLHLLLTGEVPAAGASRLGPRAGFNPRIVRLWQMAAGETPAPSAELLQTVRDLRRSL